MCVWCHTTAQLVYATNRYTRKSTTTHVSHTYEKGGKRDREKKRVLFKDSPQPNVKTDT